MQFLLYSFVNILFPLFAAFLQNRSWLSSLTWRTHEPTHRHTYHYPTHLATHTHTPTHTHTLLLKKGCSMSMLMCWQWFVLQREAVLLNPNSPGTERILSSALTAVVLQHCYFLLSSHSSCSSFLSSQSYKLHLHFYQFFHMCK